MQNRRRLFAPPEGASPSYYRDVFASAVAAFGFIVALVSVMDRNISFVFWASLLVLIAAVWFAKDRSVPLTSMFLFGALRCGIAFVFTRDLVFMAGFVICGVAGVLSGTRLNSNPKG